MIVTFETENMMIEASLARKIPLKAAVQAIAMCSKCDPHFEPRRNGSTERWHITDTSSNYVFELVVTGQRWFDVRDGKGGWRCDRPGDAPEVVQFQDCTGDAGTSDGEKKPRIAGLKGM